MKLLDIQGRSGHSTLAIGERLENLAAYIPENTVIITDVNVRSLYQGQFPPCPVIEIGTGEAVKNLDTVQTIFQRLVELEVDRSWFVVGIGGGIVCDITGFVASTYLRGIRFGFVSSTLLAQVDASVGGKNGVNFSGYKNMVGVFNQPEFVICDMELLRTLPQREVLSGLAEIIKHACIEERVMFEFLEEFHGLALALDPDTITRLVHDSVVIKSTIVNRDEREQGERRLLNFGHTFGHAFEKVLRVPHGEAVAAGMVAAATLSVNRGYLSYGDAVRIEELLNKVNLPTRFSISRKMVLDALRRDKKRSGEVINFVLLKGLGSAFVEAIPIVELEAFMDQVDLFN